MGKIHNFAEAAWLGRARTLLREQEQGQRKHRTDYKRLNPHYFNRLSSLFGPRRRIFRQNQVKQSDAGIVQPRCSLYFPLGG